jgi:hypothetical protein
VTERNEEVVSNYRKFKAEALDHTAWGTGLEVAVDYRKADCAIHDNQSVSATNRQLTKKILILAVLFI